MDLGTVPVEVCEIGSGCIRPDHHILLAAGALENIPGWDRSVFLVETQVQ